MDNSISDTSLASLYYDACVITEADDSTVASAVAVDTGYPLGPAVLRATGLSQQGYDVILDDFSGSDVIVLSNVRGPLPRDQPTASGETEQFVQYDVLSSTEIDTEYAPFVTSFAHEQSRTGNTLQDDETDSLCSSIPEVFLAKFQDAAGNHSRRERRREQNRRAAHRCRLKRKLREAAVMQEFEKELTKSRCLEAEVERLMSQKRELELSLRHYSALDPSVTRNSYSSNNLLFHPRGITQFDPAKSTVLSYHANGS